MPVETAVGRAKLVVQASRLPWQPGRLHHKTVANRPSVRYNCTVE